MELIDDFRKKYPRYWSVWLHFAAGLLAALDLLNQLGVAVPYLQGVIPDWLYATLVIGFTLAGLIARALKQSSLAPPQEPAP